MFYLFVVLYFRYKCNVFVVNNFWYSVVYHIIFIIFLMHKSLHMLIHILINIFFHDIFSYMLIVICLH